MNKLLIVDDSVLERKYLKDIASVFELEVLEAASGDEGVALYKSHKPEMVFMDIIMGDDRKSGIHALEEITCFDPDAKVIMITSVSGQEEVIQQCVKAGALEYVTKPFDNNKIIEIIKRYLYG